MSENVRLASRTCIISNNNNPPVIAVLEVMQSLCSFPECCQLSFWCLQIFICPNFISKQQIMDDRWNQDMIQVGFDPGCPKTAPQLNVWSMFSTVPARNCGKWSLIFLVIDRSAKLIYQPMIVLFVVSFFFFYLEALRASQTRSCCLKCKSVIYFTHTFYQVQFF